MMQALTELTKAQGAVMATRPASMPLHIIEGSGFLVRNHHIQSEAASAPVAEASIVLTATMLIRKSPPARVEPALKPNHPKARMNVPRTAIGMLWPGMALEEPSLLYLPMRGPSILAATIEITPPVRCTTEEPAKSTWPWPRPKFAPSCESQPPPQDPVAEDRI